jgi:hypothetical protein
VIVDFINAMADIAATIAKHGNIWTLQTNRDMEKVYEPMHALQSGKFTNSVKFEKGLKYGISERHRVDVRFCA